MSTHSRIAIEKENGSFESIYCHFDGDRVGDILKSHYNNERLVRPLMKKDSILSLETSLSKCEEIDKEFEATPTQYHSSLPSLIQFAIQHGEYYLYVFCKDNVWRKFYAFDSLKEF